MSTRQISLVVLTCDRCRQDFQGRYVSAAAARATALVAGWRFPPRGTRKKDSAPTLRTYDICTACAATPGSDHD